MSRTRRLLWLFAGLTVVALLFSSQLYMLYRADSIPVPFGALLVLQLAIWYSWAVAGPIVWRLAGWWPLRPGSRVRNGLRHAAAAITVAVAIVTVFAVSFQGLLRFAPGWIAVPDPSFRATALLAFGAYFHVELLLYGAVLAAAHAVRSNRELVERERETLQLSSQLANARLQVLTAQLQPHFLFNALHTVGSLILQRHNDAAGRILAELGDLLRITLDRQHVELITLGEELDHLQRYLRIEETRFRDRLTVCWEIDDAALAFRVPPLILQPLVENALKHGVATRTEAGTLHVRARVNGRSLRVAIYNDGPLLPVDWSGAASFGFGLRNVRERLETMGPGCTVTVANAGVDGVLATVELAHG